MAAANQYLERHYLPAYNVEFGQPAVEVGSTFIPCLGANFEAIRCEHFWRQVRPDNCVSFEALILQIPRHRHRCHFVKATVSVRRYRADTAGRAATAASRVDEKKILIIDFLCATYNGSVSAAVSICYLGLPKLASTPFCGTAIRNTCF